MTDSLPLCLLDSFTAHRRHQTEICCLPTKIGHLIPEMCVSMLFYGISREIAFFSLSMWHKWLLKEMFRLLFD